MNLRKYVGVAVGLLLLTFSAHSQGVKKPGIGPGRVVMYDVKFDGSDASRIQYVYLRLTLRTPKRPDQGNLPGQLDTVGFGISPDGVFHVSYAIPPEAASVRLKKDRIFIVIFFYCRLEGKTRQLYRGPVMGHLIHIVPNWGTLWPWLLPPKRRSQFDKQAPSIGVIPTAITSEKRG